MKWTGTLVLLCFIFLTSSFFIGVMETKAGQALPIEASRNYGGTSNPQGETAEGKFGSVVMALYQSTKYVIGAVAVFFIVYSGFRLVTANGEEEVINKQKINLYYSIMGLILISMAGVVDEVFCFGDYCETGTGSFLTNTESTIVSAGIFTENVILIASLIKLIITTVALFYIVRAGANLVVQGFNEETLTKEKKNIGIGLASLVGINLASTLVNQVFFKIEEDIDKIEATVELSPGAAEIIGITNFLITFVGPIAILSFIIGAVYYVVSFGDEERSGKAKKILVNSIIGILIVYGAYGLVATFISGSIKANDQVEENL